jgi:hypothetical protein
MHGRITQLIESWSTTKKYIPDQKDNVIFRSDTTNFIYQQTKIIEVNPRSLYKTITNYDRQGRIRTQYNSISKRKYSYTDSSVICHLFAILPFRPLESRTTEYREENIFKKDSIGRIIENRRYYNNELSEKTIMQYFPDKKIEVHVSYPASENATKITTISIYE